MPLLRPRFLGIALLPSLLLSVALAVTPAAAVPVSNPVPPAGAPDQAAYEDGVKSLTAGNLALAQKSFEAAHAADPKRVKTVLALAEVARLRNEGPATEKYLRQALAMGPANAEVTDSWSKWLFSQRRFDEARSALETTLAATPDAPELWTNLGTLYATALNNKPKAIEAFRAALKYDSTLAGTHFALGTLLAESGERAAGEKELVEAARLAPTDPRPYEMMGRIHANAGEFDKALAALDKALTVDPKYISARIAVGDIHLQAKRLDDAAKAFTQAVEINPLADGAWLRLGMLEQGRARTAMAETAYRKAIAANPNQAFALNNLATMLAEQPMTRNEALTFAERAVSLSPNPVFLDTLAAVHRARGELPKAAEYMKAAVAKAPNDASLNYRLGVVLEDSKDRAGAIAAYRKAIDLDAKLTDAKTRLAALEK